MTKRRFTGHGPSLSTLQAEHKADRPGQSFWRDDPRVTHYELVIDNGETEVRKTYAYDECEMASSAYYRAQASGAFSAQLFTYKSDGSSYCALSFSR